MNLNHKNVKEHRDTSEERLAEIKLIKNNHEVQLSSLQLFYQLISPSLSTLNPFLSLTPKHTWSKVSQESLSGLVTVKLK